MSDRLTRKEIKQQDQFQTTVGRLLEMVQVHRQKIILGVVGLVVAVLLVVAILFWMDHREASAQEMLAEALETWSAPVGEQPEGMPSNIEVFETDEARQTRAAEQFQAVRDEYGSTEAGAVAGLYLAQVAADQGDTERARELWQEFVDGADDDSMLGAQARLNLIALDRQAGQGEAVVARLEPMLDENEPALPKDVVLYQLATTLEEMGQSEQASTYFQRLVDEHSTSPYAAQARQRIGGTPMTGLGNLGGLGSPG